MSCRCRALCTGAERGERGGGRRGLPLGAAAARGIERQGRWARASRAQGSRFRFVNELGAPCGGLAINLLVCMYKQEGVVVPPPPHHPGGGWVVLGGQNQNFTEVVLYISALTGCSVHDLKNVLRNVLRITYIYLYPPPLPLVGGWF